MIVIEPLESYQSRIGSAINSREPFKRPIQLLINHDQQCDEAILKLLRGRRGEPMLIMSVVSQLRKLVKHRDRAHKDRLKCRILERIGVLLKEGSIIRIRRKFIVVRNEATVVESW